MNCNVVSHKPLHIKEVPLDRSQTLQRFKVTTSEMVISEAIQNLRRATKYVDQQGGEDPFRTLDKG